MKKYKYILFDVDDTLIDYRKSEKLSLENSCKELKVEYSEELREKYFYINKALWEDLEKGIIDKISIREERFARLFKDVDVDVKKFSDKYLMEFSKSHELVNDAVEILEYLKNKYSMSIVTNAMKEVANKRIKLAGIDKYFENIFVSENIGYSKPSKEYFDYVINVIGIDKKDILVIGDSLTSDVKGAVDSNIDVCWFNLRDIKAKKDEHSFTYEIKKLLELKEIL